MDMRRDGDESQASHMACLCGFSASRHVVPAHCHLLVFSAAGGHDSNVAEIELDRGLDNVACKIILEFGSFVAGDFHAAKKLCGGLPMAWKRRLTMAGTQA